MRRLNRVQPSCGGRWTNDYRGLARWRSDSEPTGHTISLLRQRRTSADRTSGAFQTPHIIINGRWRPTAVVLGDLHYPGPSTSTSHLPSRRRLIGPRCREVIVYVKLRAGRARTRVPVRRNASSRKM